jgi:hypothetical protein
MMPDPEDKPNRLDYASPAITARLHDLLDRQDAGLPLSVAEKDEAQGLVDLAEFFTLLRLRKERIAGY